MSAADDPAASFDRERPMLARVAYRMLGSIADAEDVVQEAYLRWAAADRAVVRSPGNWQPGRGCIRSLVVPRVELSAVSIQQEADG